MHNKYIFGHLKAESLQLEIAAAVASLNHGARPDIAFATYIAIHKKLMSLTLNDFNSESRHEQYCKYINYVNEDLRKVYNEIVGQQERFLPNNYMEIRTSLLAMLAAFE